MVKKTTTQDARRRITVNTSILIATAILFGLITVLCVGQVKQFDRLFVSLSDKPGVCFTQDSNEDGVEITKDEYFCLPEVDSSGEQAKVSEIEDYARLFYDLDTYAFSVTYGLIINVIATIGGFFTISALVGAIVYHNHAIAMLEK